MPVSAKVVKAVAAAADGYRTGEDVYIIASEDELDDLTVFDDEGEARAARARRGPDWFLFGPYSTPPSDGAPRLPERVRLFFPDGTEVEHTADEVEAVFLTEAAVARFLMPYYTGLRGVEYAAYLWDGFLSGVRNLCCKTPMSRTLNSGR